jgi:hypothetical protein
VAAGEPVGERLTVRGDADDADHWLRRERHALVHADLAVAHLEHAGDRRLDAVDQLAEPRDERRHAPLDRADVDDLGDQRVTRLGTLDCDRAGCAVDAVEVDLRDQVGLGADLAGEAVVRLEGDRVAGRDLQHGPEVGPERPDHLVTRQAVL